MSDFNRIVGELRMFIQSADWTEDPRLAGLAGEYAATCAEANERLNRCAFFLRQGLRSEALHLSKAEPDLLDMVAVLDFPERPEWDEVANAYGWPKAPALAIDAAQAIHEAYAEEDPLKDLLRLHRRLALVRAPLTSRLDVMRQIDKLDGNNPIWSEDIRRFEQARHEQMGDEIRTARAKLDAAALATILKELEPSAWTAPPPESLVKAARDAAAVAKRERARITLDGLLGPFHQAMNTNDLVQAREIRTRWLSLAQDAVLSPGDPLAGHAQPVLDWLKREDRREEMERGHQDALEDLEHAIEDKASRPLLAELEQAVLGFGKGLPDELEARLKERYRAIGRSERARNWAILGGLVATAACLAGLVLWSNAAQARNREFEKAAAKAGSYLASGRLEDARTVLEQLESTYPGASQAEVVTPVADRLSAAEQKENDRLARFSAAIAEARDASLSQAPPPALETARSLARSPSETAQVEAIVTTRQGIAARERALVDEKLLPRLASLGERTDEAEAQAKKDPRARETLAALAALRQEVPSLKEESERASEEVQSRVKTWVARLNSIDAAQAAALVRDRLLEELTRNAGTIERPEDLARYLDTADKYVAKFPDEPSGRSLRQALGEKALWQAVVAWGALVRSWQAPVTILPQPLAVERARALTDFCTTYPKYPAPATVEEYRRYVEAVSHRTSVGDAGAASSLRRMLSNPLVDHVWRVKTKAGMSYYALREPKGSDSGYLFQGLVSIDCREKQVFVPKADLEAKDRAPQTLLARRVAPLLTKATASTASWDSAMVDVLRAIKDEPELDAILRITFLKATIRAASQGSAPLGDALKSHARLIEQAQLNLDVPWVDPEDPAAELERQRAGDLLRVFPAFVSSITQCEQARRRLDSAVGHYDWPVGLLLKDPDGTWRCVSSAAIPPGVDLFVFAPNGSKAKIGKSAGVGTRAAINAAEPELLEGRLVFIQR